MQSIGGFCFVYSQGILIFMKSESGLIKLFLLLVLVLCGGFFILFFIGKNGATFQNLSNSSFANPTGGTPIGQQNPLLPQVPSSSSGSGTSILGGFLGGSSLSLGTGNAPYEVQTYSEYVTIRNNSSASVDITGYTITNGKGDRPIESTINQNLTNIPSDKSVIPQGTKYLSPDARYVLSDIILEPGGVAYVITGGPFTAYTMPISVSFQDNKCEGYLGKTYPFTPYLSNSCPRAENEVGAESVSIQCYDYLRTIYACQDAKKDDKVRHDAQTTICQQFVDKITNYKGCYDRHVGDSNFLSKDWRVFLGRPREMWAARNESIRLYDRAGKLVSQTSY